jgi:hypothetical protein
MALPSLSVLRLWIISPIGSPLKSLLELIDLFSHCQKSTKLFPIGQSQESLFHLLFGHRLSFFLDWVILWIIFIRVRLLNAMDGLGLITVFLLRGVWWLIMDHRWLLFYLLLMFLIIIIIKFLMLWLRPWVRPRYWEAARWKFIVRVVIGTYDSWRLKDLITSFTLSRSFVLKLFTGYISIDFFDNLSGFTLSE